MPNWKHWRPDPAKLKKQADDNAAKAKGRGGYGDNPLRFERMKEQRAYNFRFLPTFREDTHPKAGDPPFVMTTDHASVPPDDEGFRCPYSWPDIAETRGVVCHICRRTDDLFQEGVVSSYEDFAGHPFTSTKYNGNAIDRDAEDPTFPVIIPLAGTVYDKFIATMLSYQNYRPPIYILDPYEGRDLRITKKGKGLLTKYDSEYAPSNSPIAETEEDLELIQSRIYNLDRILRFPKDEELAKMEEAAEAFYSYIKRKMSKAGPPDSAPGAGGASSRPGASAGSSRKDAPARPAQASGSPARAASSPADDLPAGVLPCWRNHEAEHEFCTICPKETDCQAAQEKSGRREKAPGPSEVQISADLPY